MMTELKFRADAFEQVFDPQRLRNQRAIRFVLSWPAVGSQQWPCLYCPFIARGATEVALHVAMDAHARYVNAHADRATDPHFEDVRIDGLLSA